MVAKHGGDMKKLQIQTEAVTNGVNEQDTSATEQRKPTKRLTKIRRVVKWSAAAGIVIYLIYVKFLGFGEMLWCRKLRGVIFGICLVSYARGR